MGKMHELIPVEVDIEGKYKRILNETIKDFKDKQNIFIGSVRTLDMFDENDPENGIQEHLHLTTTVNERLEYTQKIVKSYFDILFKKDSTNQLAKADIIIDGKIIAENVPATYLLSMEKKFVELRKLYEQIPTLPVGIEWEIDTTQRKGVYKTVHPEIRFKTKKKFQHQVLEPARFPKEGEGGQSLPAQIEKWEDTINVGKYTKIHWSGMITSAKKSEYLERFDKIIQSIKKARQRANMQEVTKEVIANKLLNYINEGI